MKHILALLLIPFLVACNSTPGEDSATDTVIFTGSGSIAWEMIEAQTENYKLTYPNFTAGPTGIIESLNTDLPSGTASFVRQAELERADSEVWTLAIEPAYQYEDDTFASLQLNTSDQTGGPKNTYYGVVNYAVPTSQFLNLSDLFTDESYLPVLADFIRSEVALIKGETDEALLAGTQPEIDNFKIFTFEDGPEGRGLKFLFAPYQLGTYEDGPFEILVPVGILSEFVKPEYKAWFKGVSAPTAVLKTVDPAEFKALHETGNYTVLDIRTAQELLDGTIFPEVTNLDFYAKDFAEKLDQLDKQKPYLIHCQSGKRSSQALEVMESLGFQNVTELLGGKGAWDKFYDL